MPLFLGVFNSSDKLVFDWTYRAKGVTFTSNAHGFESVTFFVPMRMRDAFLLQDHSGILRLRILDRAENIYDGRVEDIKITDDGIEITALGYWRAFDDAVYTAFWSDDSLERWKIAQPEEAGMGASITPDNYNVTIDNTIRLAPKKSASYVGTSAQCRIRFDVPHQLISNRQITGIDFAFSMFLPTGWQADLYRYNSAGTFLSTIWSLTSTGSIQNGAVSLTLTGCDKLVFALYATSNPTSYTGEDGDRYFTVSNVRVVSSTANYVNTTSVGAFSGTATVTPNSMGNIFVGQKLVVGNSSLSEMVTVTAATSTTFTATFVNSYGVGTPIKSQVVYSSEIISALVTFASGINTSQLSSDTSYIQTTYLDVRREVYEDELPSSIMNKLITLGDNQTTPRRWEVGVLDDKKVYLRPKVAVRQWYVDASKVELQRSLEQLANIVYAVYTDASNFNLRTGAYSDTYSIANYGITRIRSVKSDTTNATQAGIQAAAHLVDTKTIVPQASITFTRVYDSSGAQWPLYYIRPGDAITARNLPPNLSIAIDRIRTFRVETVNYNASEGTITVSPELPLPNLASQLAA